MGNGNWVKSVWYLIGPTKLVAFGILTPCLVLYDSGIQQLTLPWKQPWKFRIEDHLPYFQSCFFLLDFPFHSFFKHINTIVDEFGHWTVEHMGMDQYINNNTIFNGMNIHLPAILMFTRGTRFWHTAIWTYDRASEGQWFQGQDLWGQRYFSGVEQLESDLAHYRSHAANLADLADRWFIPVFIGFQPSKVVDFATIHSITRKLDHIESLEVFYNSSPQK